MILFLYQITMLSFSILFCPSTEDCYQIKMVPETLLQLSVKNALDYLNDIVFAMNRYVNVLKKHFCSLILIAIIWYSNIKFNKQICPDPDVDFRQLQCMEYNNQTFQGTQYEWEAYIKGEICVCYSWYIIKCFFFLLYIMFLHFHWIISSLLLAVLLTLSLFETIKEFFLFYFFLWFFVNKSSLLSQYNSSILDFWSVSVIRLEWKL